MSDPGSYIQPRDEYWTTTLRPSVNGSSSISSTANCNQVLSFSDYDITILVVCSLSLFVGLVYTFFGYRLYRIVLFLTGFIFGSILIYLVCQREKFLSPLANAGIAVGAGLLFGLITVLVEYVGVFMTGFLTGLFVGTGIMLVLEQVFPPESFWTTIGILFISGLVFSLVTLKFERLFMVGGTALMGAGLITASLDYFIQRFATIEWLWDILNISHPPIASLCWYGWLLIALWPSLFLIGSIIQLKLTVPASDHKHHTCRQVHRPQRRGSISQRLTSPKRKSKSSRQHTPVDLTPPIQSRPLPAPPTSAHQPKSFRQLYQARRKHGDVICQSYMESLHRYGSGGNIGTNGSGTRLTMTSSNDSNTCLNL